MLADIMPHPPLIAIIDSDSQTEVLLHDPLARSGYEVAAAADSREAYHLLERRQPALVILELVLPDRNGWEVLHELQTLFKAPVLVLSQLSSEAEQVAALQSGADDYLPKPFSAVRVVARINAILSRAGRYQRLVCGPFTLLPANNEVWIADRPVRLTVREFALLKVLAGSPGKTFSRQELFACCWQQEFADSSRVIDVHLSSLRRKLGKEGDLIFTVRGTGYKLCFR